MTVEEAERAFKEMLPIETKLASIHSGTVRKYEKPSGLLYERNGALLTDVFIIVPEGENSVARYSIDKLKLSETED